MAETQLDRIERMLIALVASFDAGKPRETAPSVAPDADLDSQYGDPVVKFSPKRWTGEDFKGRPMSHTSPEFLAEYADMLEYFAANPKPGKEKYADYDRRDAARARGWMARLRARPDVVVEDLPPF